MKSLLPTPIKSNWRDSTHEVNSKHCAESQMRRPKGLGYRTGQPVLNKQDLLFVFTLAKQRRLTYKVLTLYD